MPKIVDEQMREATRRRILRVAASEFARLGFDQANINMLAEQAGIGKGTIYLYFDVSSHRNIWPRSGWPWPPMGPCSNVWSGCFAPLRTWRRKRVTASMCR